MNIIWNIKTTLETSDASQRVNVARNDVWKEIHLSEPHKNVLKHIQTIDITKDGQIFKNIPTNWFLVEN